ncbi:MAG: hypothetical protein ACYCTI_11745 [Acidimicrobiales bacterium]
MAVPVSERAPLVKALAADLAAVSTHTRVIADESSLVRQLLAETPHAYITDATRDLAATTVSGTNLDPPVQSRSGP